MSYGLGGFFGDFTDSALKTYNMVESNKRAKAQDKRAQDEHDITMKRANRDEDDEAALRAAAQPFRVAIDDHLDAEHLTEDAAMQAATQEMQQAARVPATIQQTGAIQAPTQQAITSNVGAVPIPALSGKGLAMTPTSPVAPNTQTAPVAGTAYQQPTPKVPVQDFVSGRWAAVDQSKVREATPLERLDRVNSILMAQGKFKEAQQNMRDFYDVNKDKIAYQQADYAEKATQFLSQGPQGLAKFLDYFNSTNMAGTTFSVKPGPQGQVQVLANQPGSMAPPTPIGSFNDMGEAAQWVQGLVTRDLSVAYRNISDMRTQVLQRVIMGNRDSRDAAQESRQQALFPYQLRGAQLGNASAALGIEGQALDNEGRRISNTVTGMDYGIPTGQQYTGGWTPRARNGGDNSDEAVDAKIAGAAKFLGVAPSDDISKIDPTRIAQAMALSEGGAGSLADRNNNPGNLRNADGSFKKFPTKEAGIRAAAELVRRKIASGQSSVQSIIEGLPVGGETTAAPARYAGMPITSPKAQAKIATDARDIRKDATKYASDRGDIGTPEFQKAYNQYVAMQVNSLPAPVRPQFISLLSGDIMDLTGGSPSPPTPQPKAPAPAAQPKPRGIPAPSGRQPIALPGGAFYTPSTPPAQGLVSGNAWDRSKKRPVDASLFSK